MVRGILFGALAAIVALVGGTMAYVVREADAGYHAAVDRCHDAGGAWQPTGAHSYAGTCLRAPQTRP
ncbi:MAG: hypothetical protein ACRYGP_18050 [Janthinobacterium lividum]